MCKYRKMSVIISTFPSETSSRNNQKNWSLFFPWYAQITKLSLLSFKQNLFLVQLKYNWNNLCKCHQHRDLIFTTGQHPLWTSQYYPVLKRSSTKMSIVTPRGAMQPFTLLFSGVIWNKKAKWKSFISVDIIASYLKNVVTSKKKQ